MGRDSSGSSGVLESVIVILDLEKWIWGALSHFAGSSRSDA